MIDQFVVQIDNEYDTLQSSIKNCKIAMKIIKLLSLNSQSFVYGGFVRDFLIRKEEFRDLDLFIKYSFDDDDLKLRISKTKSEFENALRGNHIEIVSITNNRETVDYMIEYQGDQLELNVIYENIENDVIDFDVNNLKFQNGIISQRIPINTCTVESIVKNIMERKCILLNNSALMDSTEYYYIKRRIKKMQKKGWHITNFTQ